MKDNNNKKKFLDEYIYIVEPHGYLYKDGFRKIKIGYTTNTKARLSLYNTMHPDGAR